MKIKILILVIFIYFSYLIFQTSDYVRYWADDFCSSVLLRDNGYFKSQIIWWNSWTGRYSYIAFLDIVALFGFFGAQILPIVLFVLFTFSIYLIVGLPLSLILSLIFLINSPNIIQTFYWMTGSLNYFAPFIFLNFYLAFLFIKRQKYTSIIGFVLLIIAVGFSESFGVATLLFLTFLFFILPTTSSKRLIVVGFIATVLSLFMMFLAPGNAVRSATVSHPDGIADLLTKTFTYSRWYLTHLLYIKEFVISVGTIIVGSFVFLPKEFKYFENSKKVIFYSVAFMIGITFVVVGLTYQAMNWEPPMRVMTVVNYMIIYSVIIFSIALAQLYRKYVPNWLSKFIFVILLILLTFQVYKQWNAIRDELKTYAKGWDKISEKLVIAPKESMVDVGELEPVGKLDSFKENKGWVSSCIAGYYNLDRLEYKE